MEFFRAGARIFLAGGGFFGTRAAAATFRVIVMLTPNVEKARNPGCSSRSGKRRWTLSDTPLAAAALLHEAPERPAFACNREVVNILFAVAVPAERRLRILAARRLRVEDTFAGLPLVVARIPPGRDPQVVGRELLERYPGEVEAFGLEYELDA